MIPDSPPVQLISKRVPLSELIRLYITEVTDQRGQDIARGIEKNLLRFMEIVTLINRFDQYTVEDKLQYRDVLQRMPKCINRKEYHGMSIDEIGQDRATCE